MLFSFFYGGVIFSASNHRSPLLWILLLIKKAMNLQSFVLSLVPFVALYLIEVSIVYFLPNSVLIPSFDFSKMVLSFPLKEGLRSNLWWGTMLLLTLFAVLKHYIDMGTKSASYGSGMISLFIMTVLAILFGVFFQSQSSFAWTLFLMTLMALSTRLFEGIKRLWLREGFFYVIITLLLLGKYGFPF